MAQAAFCRQFHRSFQDKLSRHKAQQRDNDQRKSQLMKLAVMRRMAHHTSGDTRPLIPVQENALSGSATSVAPRFKRSSDTKTQATLKTSCSQGLPNPEGRSRVG